MHGGARGSTAMQTTVFDAKRLYSETVAGRPRGDGSNGGGKPVAVSSLLPLVAARDSLPLIRSFVKISGYFLTKNIQKRTGDTAGSAQKHPETNEAQAKG